MVSFAASINTLQQQPSRRGCCSGPAAGPELLLESIVKLLFTPVVRCHLIFLSGLVAKLQMGCFKCRQSRGRYKCRYQMSAVFKSRHEHHKSDLTIKSCLVNTCTKVTSTKREKNTNRHVHTSIPTPGQTPVAGYWKVPWRPLDCWEVKPVTAQ